MRTLNRRMTSATALLVLVVGSAFAVLALALNDERHTDDVARHSELVVAQADALERTVLDLETGQRGFLIAREERFLQPWRRGVAEYDAQATRLQRLVVDNPVQEAAATAIRRGVTNYVDAYSIPLIAMARRGAPTARLVGATEEGKRRVDALRRALATFDRREQALAATRRAHSQADAARASVLGLAGLGGSMLLIVLFSLFLTRSVAGPMRRAAAAAGRLAAGDLTARVPSSTLQETARLATAFNEMAASLAAHRVELESQNAELEAQQAELSRTVDELASEKERALRVRRFAEHTAAEQEVEMLARVLVSELGDDGGAELGVVYVAGSDGGAFGLAASRGIAPTSVAPRIEPGAGLAGRVLADGRPLTSSSGDSGMRVDVLGGRRAVRHELHLPVAFGDRVLGVVSLGRIHDEPFSPELVASLGELAERAGAALSNAISFARAQHQAEVNRVVIDTALDAFVASDGAGRIVGWSPQAEALFGWSAEEAIGASATELIVPERHRDAYVAGQSLVVSPPAGGRPERRFELTARHRNGHEFLLELAVSPMRAGNDVTINAFARDVSEQRRARRFERLQHGITRALAESSALADVAPRLLAAFGTTLGCEVAQFWTVDESDDVLRCQDVWTSRDGAYGGLVAESRVATTPRGTCLAGRSWSTGAPVLVADVASEPEGTLAARAAAAGLRGAIAVPVKCDGDVAGVVVLLAERRLRADAGLADTLTAITTHVDHFWERKRAEAETERLKDEFFALVSHELRTPLTSIIGYLELVLEEETGSVSEEQRRFLGTVERNARRLLRLVGDLLFIAQVEAGNLALDRRRADLSVLVGEAVESARPRAADRDIELHERIDVLPACTADGDRIAQVLDNLIANAVKFTPPGGRIDVSLADHEGFAVIEVSDTGPGISSEEQARVFDRFFRATAATEHAVPGIGLGLTISRAIVNGHGGTIEVDSAPGRGATFRVTLPPTPAGAGVHVVPPATR